MLLRQGILTVLIFAIFIQPAFADYEIKGRLNISDEWQNQIFLSTINKLDDYYNASPENIIQVGNIEPDGSFTLEGNNLPLEPRYYRLYVVKEENSEFNARLCAGGDDHNFIHLILDNNTKIEIQAEDNHVAPYGNYQLSGNKSNQALRELGKMVFPSFYFYQIKFPSELQFSEQKLNRDLFDFADSCNHILVSLAAMINTDMDKYYDLESEKYLNFGKRLSAELNNHSYTDDYFRKMNYYNGGLNEKALPHWIYYLLFALIVSLIFTIAKIFNLSKKLSELSDTKDATQMNQIPSFTKQEEKILVLILEEKSNKEIASELYIELSTVKTHINKLYAKLGVKSRSEAKSIAKKLNFIGV